MTATPSPVAALMLEHSADDAAAAVFILSEPPKPARLGNCFAGDRRFSGTAARTVRYRLTCAELSPGGTDSLAIY